MGNFTLSIDGARIESDSSGDWITYTLRNDGSNDAGAGTLVAKYEAIGGGSAAWAHEEFLDALPAGQSVTTTQRLEGEGLQDDHYDVWVTILDGSDEAPAWATVKSAVVEGRFHPGSA